MMRRPKPNTIQIGTTHHPRSRLAKQHHDTAARDEVRDGDTEECRSAYVAGEDHDRAEESADRHRGKEPDHAQRRDQPSRDDRFIDAPLERRSCGVRQLSAFARTRSSASLLRVRSILVRIQRIHARAPLCVSTSRPRPSTTHSTTTPHPLWSSRPATPENGPKLNEPPPISRPK